MKARPTPIDNSDLTTRVYQWLKGAILHHQFRPGDKLEVGELAEQLGVSRTPVKDAINRLATEGLITLYSRRGTYVTTIPVRTYQELMEARLMIETWVADQLTQEDLDRVHDRMAELFAAGDRIITTSTATSFDYPEFFALDLAFHHSLVELRGNNTLVELYKSVMDRTTIGRLYFLNDEEAYHRSLAAHEEHRRIVEAVALRDPAQVAAALQAHIRASASHTIPLLERFQA